MPLYLYGPVLQVVDGPALAASDGCCCNSNVQNCVTICPTNNADFTCMFGDNAWQLLNDNCQPGFVPDSTACGACNNQDPLNVQACCACCVENGAP